MAIKKNWRGVKALLLLLPLLVLVGVATQSQQSRYDERENYTFRPDSERLALRGKKSSYLQFQDQEGIPSYQGWAVNVFEVALEPWPRQGNGVTGAYINLEGAGSVVDAFVLQMPQGGETKPIRHLFEEQIMFLGGEGETHIWQSDPNKKHVIAWEKGTVFSPPINTWHQHFNRGSGPARLVAVTDLPLKLDLFRNTDFIFNTNFDFTDRYAGEENYFEPEKSRDFGPLPRSHSMSIVNLVRNAWTWRLFYAGQGYHDVDRHFMLSDNTMTGHVEQFPVGTYERAHRHGPSSTIVLLTGTGYTLMWDTKIGFTPWKDGKADQVERIDWKPGTMVIPSVQWFHQHFNNGRDPARFIKLGGTPGNEFHRMTTKVLEGGERYTILFQNEDPHVRTLYQEELDKWGGTMHMPPQEELIRMEKEKGDGPLTVP